MTAIKVTGKQRLNDVSANYLQVVQNHFSFVMHDKHKSNQPLVLASSHNVQKHTLFFDRAERV